MKIFDKAKPTTVLTKDIQDLVHQAILGGKEAFVSRYSSRVLHELTLFAVWAWYKRFARRPSSTSTIKRIELKDMIRRSSAWLLRGSDRSLKMRRR